MSVWTDSDAPWTDDRGLLLGDGLFETLLVVGGVAALLRPHLARMTASASVLGLPVPDDLDTRLPEVIAALWAEERAPACASLRITLTRGAGRGLDPPPDAVPRLAVALEPFVRPASPAAAVVVDQPRIDPAGPLTGHKTLSHLPYVLARAEARRRRADIALLRTLEGDVCEADAANLFVVLEETVVTPPLDRGVLPGITRARCLEAIAGLDLAAAERPIGLGELESAREAFVTSSLSGLRPLCRIGETTLQAPGPIAVRLAACLEKGRTD